MSPIQFFLGAALLAAVVGAALLLAGRRRAVASARWAGALWLAYAGYECIVQLRTPEADIRADLLLIYPVLVLAALWSLFALLRAGRSP